MKLIVGLGNPGRKFVGTRHNAGWMALDILARRYDTEIRRRKFNSTLGEIVAAGEKIVLMKPQTYMNLSGAAVMAAVLYFDLDPATEMLVVCDDMDLPTGKLRLRASAGSGGHNGLKSVEEALNSQDWPRIRFGISKPFENGAVGHVLGAFGKSEREAIEKALEQAADAAEMWAKEGIIKAMNTFNPDINNQESAGGQN